MPAEKKKRTIPPPPGLDFVAEPLDTLIEDLRYTMENAKEFFADIAWEFTAAPVPTVIYAHKGKENKTGIGREWEIETGSVAVVRVSVIDCIKSWL